MKKFNLSFILLLMIASTPLQTKAEATSPVVKAESPESMRTGLLLNRLETINAMDKSGLTRAEKKELRVEVRTIKKDIKASGGVYVSVGALIIIILLLILLL
jgi:hypothetical protein